MHNYPIENTGQFNHSRGYSNDEMAGKFKKKNGRLVQDHIGQLNNISYNQTTKGGQTSMTINPGQLPQPSPMMI